MSVDDRDESLRAWALKELARAGGDLDVVGTMGRGAHLALLGRVRPPRLVITWSTEGEERSFGSASGDDLVTRAVRSLDELERSLCHALALGLRVALLAPPPELAPFESASLEAFEGLLRRVGHASHVNPPAQRRERAQRELDNLRSNLRGPLERCLPLRALEGALAGRSLLLAGADPSLAAQLSRIVSHRERFHVLATSAALRPLAHRGIVPDAALFADPLSCAHHVDGIPEHVLASMLLIAPAETAPEHLELPFAERALFLGPRAAWLAPLLAGGETPIDECGEAALLGRLAMRLGASNALLLGLDFSRPRADRLPAGTRSSGQAPARVEVRGFRGLRLTASERDELEREGLEALLEELSGRREAPRFVCLSLESANVRGVDYAELPRLAPRMPAIETGQMRRLAAEARTREGALRVDMAALSEWSAALLGGLDALAASPIGPRLASARGPEPVPGARAFAEAELGAGEEDAREGIARAKERVRALRDLARRPR